MATDIIARGMASMGQAGAAQAQQTADRAEQDASDALEAIGAIIDQISLCRTGNKSLSADGWSSNSQSVSINLLTTNDYVHVVGATDHDSVLLAQYGIDYTIAAGELVFTANSEPNEAINLQVAVISGQSIDETDGFCRTGTKTLAAASWSDSKQTISISNATINDYLHVVGSTAADSDALITNGVTYELQAGGILFTAVSTPASDISIKIAIVSGIPL